LFPVRRGDHISEGGTELAETATPIRQEQWQKLIGFIIGNQATWVADVGIKTGLLAAVAEAGSTGVDEATLAARLGYNERYVAVWCRAAFAFGLLDWDESTGYRMAPQMDSLLLDPTDPQFLGGRIQFYAALYEDFRAFPETLRTGRIWPRSAHDPWLIQALANLTMPDAAVFISHVLPQAPEAMARLETGGTLLEIGPGGGYALTQYAARFPNSRMVGIEFDAPSVELARDTIAGAGLADRVEIRHGDANEMDEVDAYDVITMTIVLHETGGPEQYRNVLRRSRTALAPGGTVVVSELPYPDSPGDYRTNPVYQMLAGVQIHEAQVGCGAITQNELRELMTEAGFANLRVADQPMATRFVMMGEKPV
jgi:ubiquinone/menaquinone biosynthesis C-methylase UbiE